MRRLFHVWLIGFIVAGCGSGSWKSKPTLADMERLVDELKQGGDFDRANAAEALGSLGVNGTAAIPALLSALRDENEAVRRKAAAALLAIGPNVAMLGDLRQCLKDSDQECRALAATGIGQLGRLARKALPDLRRALEDPVDRVRETARQAIGKIESQSHKTGS
jgi:HEAT repeat protein